MGDIFQLVCGCVVNGQALHYDHEHSVFECPWCDATFSEDDMMQLYIDGNAAVLLEIPRRLLKLQDERIVEITRKCDSCDSFLFRICGVTDKTEMHLSEMSRHEVQILTN